MQLFDDYDFECHWYHFDTSYKTLLGSCLVVFGVFGVLLNGWLFVTFIHSHLLTFRSHILVLNLCSGALGRNLLGFPFTGSSAFAKRWLFGSACCQLFGFFNTFLGVFQMASIFTICIERYFQAKCYKHDKELSLKLYCGLVGGCWLTSLIFATPPLLNYGSYSCDITQTACSLSWSSFNSGARYFGYNIPYAIFAAILPVFFILHFVIKALRLERKVYRSEQQKENRQLTKCLHAACLTTLVMWTPAAVLVGWQWFPLLWYGYRLHVPPTLVLIATIASESTSTIAWATMACWSLGAVTIVWVVSSQLMYGFLVQPPLFMAMIALLSNEAAPGVVVLAAFWSNERVRGAMLSLLGEPTHSKDS